MIQKKSLPAGDSQLWLEMRRLENSWRSISDMQLALLDRMIAIDPDAGQKAYATIMKGFPPQPWPCVPPSPCTRSLEDLSKLIRLLGRLSENTVQGFQSMLADAKELGIKDVTFRLRQFPGYPEGALPEGAAAGMAGNAATEATDR
jgi:hypothetical protein